MSHNLEWHDVVSLLEALGEVQETHKGHLVVRIEGETETFEPRAGHKDVGPDDVSLLRKFLKRAGYSPEGAEA